MNQSATYENYTKEKFKTYIQDAENNLDQIREMSGFLYQSCMIYQRIVKYSANLPYFYWNLTPLFNDTANVDSAAAVLNYNQALALLHKMRISNEMRKILSVVIREGVYYGFAHNSENQFCIQKLDPKFCKIDGDNDICSFSFDFSYFDQNPDALQSWGNSFAALYEKYQQDATLYRWQPLEQPEAICIKTDTKLPLFTGIFDSLLDFIDYKSLQRNNDELEAQKLLLQKVPFNDLDMDIAVKFYDTLTDKISSALPLALTPMDAEAIEFSKESQKDDMLSRSYHHLLSDAGISESIFNDTLANHSDADPSVKTDAAMIWEIVKEIENWINRYIAATFSGSQMYLFEILPIDIFNIDLVYARELKLAESGLPNKLRLAASAGIDPYQVLSSQYFENDVLQIHTHWKPLNQKVTV